MASSAAAPNMIGDFFGGIGACEPVFVGQAIFHSAASPLGNDDFHLIHSGSPATFQGGAGGATGVAFAGSPDNLVGLGRPGQRFVAVPTGEFANVNDPSETMGEFDSQQIFNIYSSMETDICVPSPGTSAVGRVKIAENTSPIPRDRVFVNYSYFHNVPLGRGGVDVDRFVPGFEKTFFSGMTSIEMRFPFAATLDSNLLTDGPHDTSNAEYGNMSLVSKTLLIRNQVWAMSGGIQVALPTADDVTISTVGGTPLVFVENQAVHLMPFVGGLYTPNDRLFFQWFLQVDFNANNNPVEIRDPFVGALAPAGGLDDTDFMYLDLSLGYWIYRNNSAPKITGLAPLFELHWNSSLESTGFVEQDGFRVGTNAGNVDLVNLVAGLVVECGGNTTITAAYTGPAVGGANRDFDGEFRLLFNHRFGPQNRLTRAQF